MIAHRWRRYITRFLLNGWQQPPPSPAFVYSKPSLQPNPWTYPFKMSTPASTSDIPQSTSVSALTPVITHTTWSAPEMHIMNPMDESFGYTLSTSRSHESRHDQRQSTADIPPPYSEESAIPLPEYTLHSPEPVTLAMYLFKFGFRMFSLFRARIYPDHSMTVFPPFWIFGAFILMSPLREPPTNTTNSVPAWMPEKTEDERKEIIARLREVELKWAKRCLCAILMLTVAAVIVGLAAWVVFRRWFEPVLFMNSHSIFASQHSPFLYLNSFASQSWSTELYNQQNFAFLVYLTNSLFPWRSASLLSLWQGMKCIHYKHYSIFIENPKISFIRSVCVWNNLMWWTTIWTTLGCLASSVCKLHQVSPRNPGEQYHNYSLCNQATETCYSLLVSL